MRLTSFFASSIERLVGDRNGQLEALRGKSWDAVIDDSATNPDWVRMSTDALKGNARQYTPRFAITPDIEAAALSAWKVR